MDETLSSYLAEELYQRCLYSFFPPYQSDPLSCQIPDSKTKFWIVPPAVLLVCSASGGHIFCAHRIIRYW